MTISYTDPGEAGKLPYWYQNKHYEVPDDTLEEARARHPRAWAILTRPKHTEASR